MNWQFASAAVKEELGRNPEFPGGVEVKSNPVRTVYRSGGYFIKEDRRKGNRLRREFESAQLLQKLGLPVVESLALGEGDEKSLLVTRAFPGESVGDYYYKTFIRDGADPETFLNEFTAFVRKVLESKIFHPDFHAGNILYRPDTKEFALVDVYGVRKRNFFDRFRMYRMRRIPMELRAILGNGRMIELFRGLQIPHPRRFWHDALRREADYLRKEWPKRKRQILSGYPKFTVREGDMLRAVDPLRRVIPLEEGEVLDIEEGKAEDWFLRLFYARLALVASPLFPEPVAFDCAANILYVKAVKERIPVRDVIDRLRISGIHKL